MPILIHPPILIHSPLHLRPVCTYYEGSPGPLADGTRYSQASPFVASRVYPLGSRLRLTNPKTGRSLVVTVRDRTAPGRTNLDLPKRFWHQLSSRGGYRVGVLHLTVRVLSHPVPSGRRRHHR